MSKVRLNHVQCLDASGLHRMAYWEWGDPQNDKVLVCVHGLTRQGRDFDHLAQSLCGHYRVVCPDVVGRGQSDWLRDPRAYQVSTYVADMVTLLARLNASTVHWVGTSMGGLIGMLLSGMLGSPVQKLVLNDVGPVLEFGALARIGDYLGQHMRFPSKAAVATYLSQVSVGFGPHTPQQWAELSEPQSKPDGDGFLMHYDPQVAVPFRGTSPEAVKAGEAMLWAAYDGIKAPTLLLRGKDSDLLSPETAFAMTQRGPRAKLIELEGVGHAPTLVQADQIDAVTTFLLSP